MTIEMAIENEKDFFSRHSTYSIYSEKLGIPYLSKSMNKILINHIQRCIPNLNKQIAEHLQQKERELALLKIDDPDMQIDKGPMILSLINKFLNSYGDKIEGRFVKEIAFECQGGARINFIFHHIFKKVINDINPFEYLTEQDIQTAIKNTNALNQSLFVPEAAFEVLVRQQIARLLDPSIDCAYEVYEELRKIVISIQLPELKRYYRLQTKICDVMENVLDKCLSPTVEMIANIIEIENGFINKNHPDFEGSADSLLNLFQTDQEYSSNNQKTYGLMQTPDKTPNQKKGSTTGSPQEIEVIEESKSQDNGGLFGTFTGYLGKGKEKKASEEQKSQNSEQKGIEEKMIAKAKTRKEEEESAMNERNISQTYIGH